MYVQVRVRVGCERQLCVLRVSAKRVWGLAGEYAVKV